jgi:ribonuclease HI/DNA polymerase-3 subunit epsilon
VIILCADVIIAYIDGACRGNPGPGGWGVVIIQNNTTQELYGGDKWTSNNRMELRAAIVAIQNTPIDSKLTIYSDSTYVVKGATEWINTWRQKWQRSNKMSVKNKEVWQELDSLMIDRDIQWSWVRGHNNHLGNERADQLANKGIDELLDKLHN